MGRGRGKGRGRDRDRSRSRNRSVTPTSADWIHNCTTCDRRFATFEELYSHVTTTATNTVCRRPAPKSSLVSVIFNKTKTAAVSEDLNQNLHLPSLSLSKYHFLDTIGKGGFSEVKLAKHLPTGEKVAIKIIDKTQLTSKDLEVLLHEVKIMKLLDHPNIVKLFQVIDTENKLYLVMEYVSGGELFDHIVIRGKLEEDEARAIFRQVVSAVQYCHQKKIIHRDLKAENLLLDIKMNIKLADFGFSTEFTAGNKLDTFCGSPEYAAPELILEQKYDGPEVDVWSLGVVLYTLVCGSLPFDGATCSEVKERILSGEYFTPSFISTDCQNLLQKFLVLNPAERSSLETIMKDKWMNIGYEDEQLKPCIETETEYNDPRRMEMLVGMGYRLADIEKSVNGRQYDDIFATYLLLGRRSDSDEVEGDGSFTRASQHHA